MMLKYTGAESMPVALYCGDNPQTSTAERERGTSM